MSESEPLNGGANLDSPMWRGIDFSGVTVVVGAGTGRLLELLLEQVSASRGNLLLVSQRLDLLQPLAPLGQAGEI